MNIQRGKATNKYFNYWFINMAKRIGQVFIDERAPRFLFKLYSFLVL